MPLCLACYWTADVFIMRTSTSEGDVASGHVLGSKDTQLKCYYFSVAWKKIILTNVYVGKPSWLLVLWWVVFFFLCHPSLSKYLCSKEESLVNIFYLKEKHKVLIQAYQRNLIVHKQSCAVSKAAICDFSVCCGAFCVIFLLYPPIPHVSSFLETLPLWDVAQYPKAFNSIL